MFVALSSRPRPAVMLLLACLLAVTGASARAADGVRIVAAEAVYGDIARQIAGPGAQVSSLLVSPAGDPHDYEPDPSAARAMAGADILIANGAGYEPWFDRLVPAGATVLRLSTLLARPPDANPHLWTDPRAGAVLAEALARVLAARDPAQAAAIRSRCDAFRASLAPMRAELDRLHDRLARAALPLAITATEPVLGPLLDALPVVQADQGVQRAVMNGTEPGPLAVAVMQDGLDKHRDAAMVFNAQVISPLSVALRARATADGIPTVSVTETLPRGLDYQDWMMRILTQLDQALPNPPARP